MAETEFRKFLYTNDDEGVAHYRADGVKGVIVTDAEEYEEMLADDWVKSPAEVSTDATKSGDPEAEAANQDDGNTAAQDSNPVEMARDELYAEAERLGIEYSKRWSGDKFAAEFEKAQG